jgi:signal transduction histidine kinase
MHGSGDDVDAELAELRAAQRALEASCRHYAELYEHLPVAVVTLDEQGIIVEGNLTASVALRAERPLAGRALATLLDAKHEDIVAHVRTALASARRTLTDVACRAGGTVELVSVAARGGDARVWTALHDLSERRHGEDVLRLLAATGDAVGASLDPDEIATTAARLAVPFLADVAVVDLAATETTWRRAAVATRERDEDRWLAAVEPAFSVHPELRAAAKQAIERGTPVRVADLGPHQGGDTASFAALAPHAAVVAPLRSEGRTLGVLTLLSSRPGRDFGGDSVALVGELARRVSAALANSALHAAVVAANRAKNEFLAIVSHELRTPLAAVFMWTHTLRAASSPEARNRAIAALERAAQMQSRLVEDLVDVARSVGGRLSLSLERVGFTAIVHGTIDALAGEAQATGVRLSLAVDPAVGTGDVWGDPHRLAQIAGNLVANAIKYSDKGGNVRVELDRDAEDVRLRVADEGRGIDAAVLPHVFELFKPGEHGGAGLGVGLAIARELTRLHGGTIDADSAGAGKGATFTVRLPALPAREK